MSRKTKADPEMVPLKDAEEAVAERDAAIEERDAQLEAATAKNRELAAQKREAERKARQAKDKLEDEEDDDELATLRETLKNQGASSVTVVIGRLYEQDATGQKTRTSTDVNGDLCEVIRNIPVDELDLDDLKAKVQGSWGGGGYLFNVKHRGRAVTDGRQFAVIGGKSIPIGLAGVPGAVSGAGTNGVSGTASPEVEALKKELAELREERRKAADEERLTKLIALSQAPMLAELKVLRESSTKPVADPLVGAVSLLKTVQGDPKEHSNYTALQASVEKLRDDRENDRREHDKQMREMNDRRQEAERRADRERHEADVKAIMTRLEKRDRDKSPLEEMTDNFARLALLKKGSEVTGLKIWDRIEKNPKLNEALDALFDKALEVASPGAAAKKADSAPSGLPPADEAFRVWVSEQSRTTPAFAALNGSDADFVAAVQAHGPFLAGLIDAKTRAEVEALLVKVKAANPGDLNNDAIWAVIEDNLNRARDRLMRTAQAKVDQAKADQAKQAQAAAAQPAQPAAAAK